MTYGVTTRCNAVELTIGDLDHMIPLNCGADAFTYASIIRQWNCEVVALEVADAIAREQAAVMAGIELMRKAVRERHDVSMDANIDYDCAREFRVLEKVQQLIQSRQRDGDGK